MGKTPGSRCRRNRRSPGGIGLVTWAESDPHHEEPGRPGHGRLHRRQPEANRRGIPHPREWDLWHAMHLIRDVAYELAPNPQEGPQQDTPSTSSNIHLDLNALQELMEPAIDAPHHPSKGAQGASWTGWCGERPDSPNKTDR